MSDIENTTTTTGTKNQVAVTLSASYQGPSDDSFAVKKEISLTNSSLQISSAETMSLEDRTSFLKDLRASVAAVQDQVNRELTQRMEADKVRETGTAAAATVNHADEEQNYGEEEVIDDDA